MMTRAGRQGCEHERQEEQPTEQADHRATTAGKGDGADLYGHEDQIACDTQDRSVDDRV